MTMVVMVIMMAVISCLMHNADNNCLFKVKPSFIFWSMKGSGKGKIGFIVIVMTFYPLHSVHLRFSVEHLGEYIWKSRQHKFEDAHANT